MLTSLHIENIAIIKQLDLDFSNGFSVMTGETVRENPLLLML